MNDDSSSRGTLQEDWFQKWLRHSEYVLAFGVVFAAGQAAYTWDWKWLVVAVGFAVVAMVFEYQRRSIKSLREVYDELES